MKLRRGKTKNILEGSIDAALLAVEVYNKPRTTFRSQAYIVLMIIAWTRLFHAYFNITIGNKYYYKEPNGRYQDINGERKAWELKTCINKYEEYENLSKAVMTNLQFFIGLRNKIEHRNVAKKEVDVLIFGECLKWTHCRCQNNGKISKIIESHRHSFSRNRPQPALHNRDSGEVVGDYRNGYNELIHRKELVPSGTVSDKHLHT